MKYYLCKIGSFQDGGEERIKDDCLEKNIYQYYKWVRQKGAGEAIQNGDILILVFRKNIVAYGTSCGRLGDENGIDTDWQAVKVKEWIKAEKNISLPYGVWWHTLVGNKQSIVKEIDESFATDLITQIYNDSPVKVYRNVTASDLLKWSLVIPEYQRPYSWQEKNIRDFLVDISLWQQDERKKEIPYHLGTIILKEQEDGCYDVIDGQQRLTTLAIIANNNDDKAIPLLASVKKYTDSEIQTILRARNYISNSKTDIKFDQIKLSIVILGEDQPEDLAYTFFSNSNSTGKRLSDYDLLKTHHLRYIKTDEDAEKFSKSWHDLEKSDMQDEVLQCMLFRLRKWINNESFPLDANNRESRDIFHHYKSVDLLREFPVCKIPFRFNSLLSGGKEFFDYTEHYRKKYDVFIEQDAIKMLTAYLSGHSNNVILSGIKAIAFLFFCKFGEMYLKEAVYLLAYRLSVLRNETQVRSAYLSDDKKGTIFRETTRQLDQVTSAAQFFALLSDAKKRYAEANTGNAASRYWKSLHALMSSLEEKTLAIIPITIPTK